MKMKLHQVLTAYVCDTAQTEVTSKGAQKYLRDHDILDTDIERISEQFLKRQLLEMKVKSILLHFHVKGMRKINNWLTNNEQVPDFEQLYEDSKEEINAILNQLP